MEPADPHTQSTVKMPAMRRPRRYFAADLVSVDKLVGAIYFLSYALYFASAVAIAATVAAVLFRVC